MVLEAFFLLPAHGYDSWFPHPVDVWTPAFDLNSPRETLKYIPLVANSPHWNICVSFPHMKDSYWLAINYGIVEEVKRMGIKAHILHAGGYNRLQLQLKQIEKCLESGGHGAVIAAISYDGLNPLIAKLRKRNIPVIDLVNGMSSADISAKSLVSFEEMGFKAGEYILNQHSLKDKKIKVAWFPGPKEAGWVQKGDQGFKRALKNSNIEIVATRFGDTGKLIQSRLLERTLDQYPDIDYVAGTAVTAEAAVDVLKKRNLDAKIQIVSYYFTPGVYQGIRDGAILAAPTDSPVIQARIAIDQMVRALEGTPYHKHVGPKLIVIDKDNVSSFDQSTSLAPKGFSKTMLVQ